MGTGQNSRDTQKVAGISSKPPRCSLCKHEYSPTCDFMQGRCPHHPAMISTQAVRTRFNRFNRIIKFFKGTK